VARLITAAPAIRFMAFDAISILVGFRSSRLLFSLVSGIIRASENGSGRLHASFLLARAGAIQPSLRPFCFLPAVRHVEQSSLRMKMDQESGRSPFSLDNELRALRGNRTLRRLDFTRVDGGE